MNRKRQQMLDDRIRTLDPVGTNQPVVGQDEVSADELLRSILASAPIEATPVDRRRRRPPLRRFVLPVAALALIAVLLGVGILGGQGGRQNGVDGVLGDVAAAAAAQPAPAALPIAYLKTRDLSIDTAVAAGRSWSVYEDQLREEWVAEDGSGRARTVSQAPRFVGPGDREAWEAAGRLNFLAHGFNPATGEESLPAATGGGSVRDLPTDPELLAGELRREAQRESEGVPLPARILELIGDDLRDPAAGPALRTALYEAASSIPGIESFGPETDPVGRDGVGVGVVSSYSGVPERFSLIFDPQSSLVLATTNTALKPVSFADGKPPLLLSATVYLASDRVADTRLSEIVGSAPPP